MRTDSQIKQLEQEIKALKTSFEQSASMLTVYTEEISFQTSMNVTNFTNSGSYNPLEWQTLVAMNRTSDGTRFSIETVQVTFRCEAGINTFASLEIDKLNGEEAGLRTISQRRIPYSGGARWLVTVAPNATLIGTTGYYSWNPTQLKFAVQSAVKGTLEAKMIWQ